MRESIVACIELADPRTLPDDGLGQGPTAPSIDLDYRSRRGSACENDRESPYSSRQDRDVVGFRDRLIPEASECG